MASVTGTVAKFQTNPPGFTIKSDPDPPGTPVPFADCTTTQLSAAMTAWGNDKKLKVTFPDGGGAATNVENA
jgi:hypothetical protein